MGRIFVGGGRGSVDTGAGAGAASGQSAFTSNDSGPDGPNDPVVYEAPPYTSATGVVLIIAMISVQGGSSTHGDGLNFQLTVDGNAQGPNMLGELSPTNNADNGTVVGQVHVAPGSTHTFGVQANNATTPGHTLVIPQGHAAIYLQDV